ncbi:MAG TPA: hypothetical protein VN829_07040 [Dongiaceae bacterium]|nr:hypothetical protein [Dongiaceae bacterium]
MSKRTAHIKFQSMDAKKLAENLLDTDLSVQELIARDRLCEMANLRPRLTGLPFNIFVSEREYAPARHRPRVKVFDRQRQIDASIAVDEPVEVLAGTAITGKDWRALETYILQNRELLLALWDGEIDQDQFTQRQRPLHSNQ